MKGSASRTARRRPIEDLPAPIMPTSTIGREPSAATKAASPLDNESVSGLATWDMALFRKRFISPTNPRLRQPGRLCKTLHRRQAGETPVRHLRGTDTEPGDVNDTDNRPAPPRTPRRAARTLAYDSRRPADGARRRIV